MTQLIKTPIALFTYNRPIHTRKVLESLSKCKRLDECSLFIYCDGPKNQEELKNVHESRDVVNSFTKIIPATIIMQDANLGLAHSIVSGVTDLCQKFGRVIVIEDDFILSPSFIDYMLQSLDRFQNETHVFQISGFMFPISFKDDIDTFFFPYITTWGWATWERAWKYFDWKAKGYQELLSDNKNIRKFNLDNSYPYFDMLTQRFAGKNDSWGILWWYVVYKNQGIVLHPKRSLVWVGGFDGSGTHCGTENDFNFEVQNLWIISETLSLRFPDNMEVNDNAYLLVKKFLTAKNKKPILNKFRKILKKLGYMLTLFFQL